MWMVCVLSYMFSSSSSFFPTSFLHFWFFQVLLWVFLTHSSCLPFFRILQWNLSQWFCVEWEELRSIRQLHCLVCGHCPILVLLPRFWRGEKKLDETDGVRVLEFCLWQDQPWLSVSHLCKIIKYGDEETLVFNFLKVIKPGVLNPRPANTICVWGKKRWMDQLE